MGLELLIQGNDVASGCSGQVTGQAGAPRTRAGLRKEETVSMLDK